MEREKPNPTITPNQQANRPKNQQPIAPLAKASKPAPVKTIVRDPKRPMANRIVVLDVVDAQELRKVKNIVKQLGGRTTETIESSITYVSLVSDSPSLPVIASYVKSVDRNTLRDSTTRTSAKENRVPTFSQMPSTSKDTTAADRKRAVFEKTIKNASPLMRVAVRSGVRLHTVTAFLTRAYQLRDQQTEAMKAAPAGNGLVQVASKKRRRKTSPVVGRPLKATMITKPFVYMGDLTGVHAPLVRTVDADCLALHVGADLHLCRYESAFVEPSHAGQTPTVLQSFLPPKIPPPNVSSIPHAANGPPSVAPKSTANAKAVICKASDRPILPGPSIDRMPLVERDLSPLKSKSTYCNVCKMDTQNLNQHIESALHKEYVKSSGIFARVDEFMFTKHDLIPSLHRLPSTDAPCATSTLVGPPSSLAGDQGDDNAVAMPSVGPTAMPEETPSVISENTSKVSKVSTCNALNVENLLSGACNRVKEKENDRMDVGGNSNEDARYVSSPTLDEEESTERPLLSEHPVIEPMPVLEQEQPIEPERVTHVFELPPDPHNETNGFLSEDWQLEQHARHGRFLVDSYHGTVGERSKNNRRAVTKKVTTYTKAGSSSYVPSNKKVAKDMKKAVKDMKKAVNEKTSVPTIKLRRSLRQPTAAPVVDETSSESEEEL